MPVDTKPIDIELHKMPYYRTMLRPITPKGYLWIRENMDHDSRFTVVLNNEFVEEVVSLMKKSNLVVKYIGELNEV